MRNRRGIGWRVAGVLLVWTLVAPATAQNGGYYEGGYRGGYQNSGPNGGYNQSYPQNTYSERRGPVRQVAINNVGHRYSQVTLRNRDQGQEYTYGIDSNQQFATQVNWGPETTVLVDGDRVGRLGELARIERGTNGPVWVLNISAGMGWPRGANGRGR